MLLEVDGLPAVLDLAAAVRQAAADRRPGFTDVVDVVPAATTVLVTVEEGHGVAALTAAVARLGVVPGSGARADAGEPVLIPVTYDGSDLAEVAALTGLSAAEVVTAHTGSAWRVAFGGFAPGFGYLTSASRTWDVPRRGSPRTRVPAGSVALAGEFSGVYPRESPGGWQLIGRTEVAVFDLSRDPAALLRPGNRVRFVDVGRA